MSKKDTKRPVYEPPVLRVLGTAHTLTQGPLPGLQPDVTIFHPSA